MKVMLIVKADLASEALDYTRAWLIELKHKAIPIPVLQLRMGAFRVEVDLEETSPVYYWFNKGGYDAPYPNGTLLFFTVSP